MWDAIGAIGPRTIGHIGETMEAHLRPHEAKEAQGERLKGLRKAAGREKRSAAQPFHHEKRRAEELRIGFEQVGMRHREAVGGQAVESS